MNVRHVRRFSGIALLGVLAWMAWLLVGVKREPRSLETEEEVARAGTLPAADNEETGCFDDFVLDWSGDHLEAGRACKQPDGSSRLEAGVLIRFGSASDHGEVTVRAERGLLPAAEEQPVELSGKVEVSTPGPTPLQLECESLSILKATKTVKTDKPVTFHQGEVSGKAGALEHQWEDRITRLSVDPVVIIQGQGTDGRVVTLTADRIERQELRHLVILQGRGKIDFGEGKVEGDHVDVNVDADGQHVHAVEAVGNARTTTHIRDASGGDVVERVLSAARIRHQFAGGNRLSVVDAEGAASLVGRPVSGAGASESLTGQTVHLHFTPDDPPMLSAVHAQGAPASFERTDASGRRAATGNDLAVTLSGQAVERLTASGGAVRLEEAGPRGTQLLEAQSAELRFAPGGLVVDELDFDGTPATLTDRAPGRAAPRRVVAKKGRLILGADGAPIGGFLEGGVKLEEPGSRAKGDKVEFAGPPRRTTLTGHALVEQGGRTSHGDHIVRDEGAGTLVVEGTQHTIVHDAKDLPGMEASVARDEPIYVSADKLVLDEKSRHATYSGGRPALRRGDTEIIADEIVIDDRRGSLDATGSVMSRLRLAQPGSQQAPEPGALFDPTRLVESVSDEIHYTREESIVRYVGSAKLSQEEASIAADRVDIRLEKGTSRVEGCVAEGSALFKSPDREAEGQRIEYRASNGSVRVDGGRRPARARDSKGQFVSGGVVEFDADGTVRVISPALGRTRGAAPVEPESPGT